MFWVNRIRRRISPFTLFFLSFLGNEMGLFYCGFLLCFFNSFAVVTNQKPTFFPHFQEILIFNIIVITFLLLSYNFFYNLSVYADLCCYWVPLISIA